MRRLCIIALLASCAASEDVPAPQVASISPSRATPGTIVMLAGSYFCQRPNNGNEDPTCDSTGTVEFDTVPATATSWADNAIMVEVPSGTTGNVDVSVTASGRISNSISFTIE